VGVLLAYYVYVDGEILENLQKTLKLEALKEQKTYGGEYPFAYSVAHVKVTNGERQYGAFKSIAESTRKSMIIASEAQKLAEDELLEITCKSGIASEMRVVLGDRLGRVTKCLLVLPQKGEVFCMLRE
jgi:hypothetical protein